MAAPNPKKVMYQDGSLVINIPESDPAYLHVKLLHGLTLSMRNFICTDAKANDDDDKQLALIALLEHLLPDERMLAGKK